MVSLYLIKKSSPSHIHPTSLRYPTLPSCANQMPPPHHPEKKVEMISLYLMKKWWCFKFGYNGVAVCSDGGGVDAIATIGTDWFSNFGSGGGGAFRVTMNCSFLFLFLFFCLIILKFLL